MTTATTPTPARGCWVLTNVTSPFPALRMLWDRLPGATTIVTLGGRRSWLAAAGAESDASPAFGARGEMGEQRLHASLRTMDLLVLAAKADDPAPFCRELRVLAGDELLLRWMEPVRGALRLSSRVPTPRVWELAHHLHVPYGWDPSAL